MSLTSTQINEIFAAMGLPAPSSAVATSLEAIPNTYDALNTIIASARGANRSHPNPRDV